MDWKDELNKILENGCTDSDIEDFVYEHPEVDGKNIWDYVYEYNAPDVCKGCKYIQFSGWYPCIMCSRKIKTEDYYESR